LIFPLGLYQQESDLNGLTLFQLKNKAGIRILRVEKGVGKDGDSAFWHKHRVRPTHILYVAVD
jgi:hypothetical protein